MKEKDSEIKISRIFVDMYAIVTKVGQGHLMLPLVYASVAPTKLPGPK